MLTLTDEQKTKLANLEKEMADKARYDNAKRAQNAETARQTGLPLNIVSMDVVKFGRALGIINTKEDFETGRKSMGNGLLSLFSGSSTDANLYVDVPIHYELVSGRIGEHEKLAYQSQLVRRVCDEFQHNVARLIRNRIECLRAHVTLSLVDSCTMNAFVNECVDTTSTLCEFLNDVNSDDEFCAINDQINALFASLLWFVDLSSYKQLVLKTIRLAKLNSDKPLRLSPFVATLCFSRNDAADNAADDATMIESAIETQLTVNQYTRDPKLAPFDVYAVTRSCCSLALMFVDVRRIVACSLIGPFNNNSIGYLPSTTSTSVDRSFYILSRVTPTGNVRMWVLDDGATTTTTTIVRALKAYATELFKTVYRKLLGTNDYVVNFWTTHTAGTALRALLDNVSRLDDIDLMTVFVRRLLAQRSVIVPTELDVFNALEPFDDVVVKRNDAATRCPALFESNVCENFRKIWPTLV